MDTVEQLEKFLSENIDEAIKTPFVVDSMEKAIWAMRKIANIDLSVEEVNKAADAEIERINAWRDEEVRIISSQRKFFEGLLEGYHRRIMAENPKKKTIKLPHGQLQIRAQKPDFIRDDEKIIKWAEKEMPKVVIRKPKLDWSALKDSLKVDGSMAFSSNGEIIPGITVVPRGDKFNIKLAVV
jgi:phage host-nuclease inhibitor protein Gam